MSNAVVSSELVLHPNRFPLHNDPTKGQILNGMCNTYGCNCTNARYWCSLTFAFYCADCASEINHGPSPSCEEVAHKPNLYEMRKRHRYAYKAYRACPTPAEPSHPSVSLSF